MKKILTIGIVFISLIVILFAWSLQMESNRSIEEKIHRVFELGDARVSDIRWAVVNNVTGRENGRMELPTQDATYHVEGSFKVSGRDFLPEEGTPGTPEGFVALTDIPATGWLWNEDFQKRILKRTDLTVKVFFAPESGVVLFKID